MADDNITPFVFDSLPVRGALISLSRAWRRAVTVGGRCESAMRAKRLTQ